MAASAVRSGRDDRLLEVDRGHAAFGEFYPQLVRGGEAAVAADGGDLALLGQPGQAAVSRPTTPSFHARSLPRSIAGAPNMMPCSLISLVSR